MRSDYKMWHVAALAAGVLGACDLKELDEANGQVGGVDSAVEPQVDSAPVEMPDAGPPPVDATPPADAGFGSCNREHWTATASNVNGVHSPQQAIDGLLPSRYASGTGQGVGQYFQLDFGGRVKISKVSMEHAFEEDGLSDYPRAVVVLGSNDGVTFGTTLGSTGPVVTPGPTVDVSFAAAEVTALRLQLDANDGNWWWSLHELHVTCEQIGEPVGLADAGVGPNNSYDGGLNPNKANWTVLANFTGRGEPAANAVDGDAGSRWASGKEQYGDEDFTVDLGALLTVSAVHLTATGNDYPSAYVIELSTDGSFFRPVASGLGSVDVRKSFARTPASHVRIRQIGVGHKAWWGINEITIAD